MENAHICWKDSRGAVRISRGSCVLPWRCSQTVSRFIPVSSGASCSPRVYCPSLLSQSFFF